MAVPTSYTYETFADYLKDEVLRDAADGVGYGDLVPEIPAIVVRVEIRTSGTPPYNFTNGIPIFETGYTIAQGTSLAFSNGQTRTLAAQIDPTDTTMDINGLGAALSPGHYANIQLRAAVARVRNPIYDAITNEVLLQMGLGGIEEVNADNIEFFRQYGRIEVLRKAMQNVAANFQTNMPVGGMVNSDNIHANLARMFDRERNRLNRLIAEEVSVVPDEAQSANIGVTLVW